MLTQLASLASLACVRPLITCQAFQLAGAESSHPLWTLAAREESKGSSITRSAEKKKTTKHVGVHKLY